MTPRNHSKGECPPFLGGQPVSFRPKKMRMNLSSKKNSSKMDLFKECRRKRQFPGNSAGDFFGMVKWLFSGVVGDLQRLGIKRSRIESPACQQIKKNNCFKKTLNKLVKTTFQTKHLWPNDRRPQVPTEDLPSFPLASVLNGFYKPSFEASIWSTGDLKKKGHIPLQ